MDDLWARFSGWVGAGLGAGLLAIFGRWIATRPGMKMAMLEDEKFRKETRESLLNDVLTDYDRLKDDRDSLIDRVGLLVGRVDKLEVVVQEHREDLALCHAQRDEQAMKIAAQENEIRQLKELEA